MIKRVGILITILIFWITLPFELTYHLFRWIINGIEIPIDKILIIKFINKKW